MKPDLTYEQLERRRRILRWVFLAIAILLTGAGYALLAVPPETPMEEVITHVVWGMALLVAGFFVALLSRLVP
jgi:uncharacterized membrane protein HdeD (DUF308 family)